MTVIVHVTSVHSPDDVRIFQKECRSIAEAGYRVILVAPDATEGAVDGVELVRLRRPPNRLRRMVAGAWSAWRAAARHDADVFHFHDPELLPGGLLLALRGRRVVYDAHEEVGADLIDRDYLPRWILRVVAPLVGSFELAVARRVSAVVAATPAIARRHRGARRTILVANYPRFADFAEAYANPIPHRARPCHIAYVGLISRERGCREMLDALELVRDTGVRLQLAGRFDSPALEEEARSHSAWNIVDYHGTIPHAEVRRLLSETRAGLVLFLPGPNHMEAQPNKLFEYMASGLPVIASHFPRWIELVVETRAGVVADPTSASAIANAIRIILADPDAAEAMGRRGMQAVEASYNWERQAEALLAGYAEILRA
ncbi:MAG TPA: glycosyltransferase family 4 protein [Bryobacteraceae bacterium]|nr:glycosyltransferase family 4 protein [Bryobacteraceae bacterium]